MSRSASPASVRSFGSANDVEVPVTITLEELSGNPEAQLYFKAMINAQQDVGRLKSENKALKTELYELKLSRAKPTRGRKAKRSAPAPGPADDSASAATAHSAVSGSTAESSTELSSDETVAFFRRIGSYHQLHCMPIIPHTAFGFPKPPFGYENIERYAGDNIQLGATADLYDCTPRQYHPMIADGSAGFQKYYLAGGSAGLSSALHRLRSVSGEVFDIKQEVFRNLEVVPGRSKRSKKHAPAPLPPVEKSETSRANHPAIRRLLGITSVTKTSNGEKVVKDVYPDIPPVMYKPGHEGNAKYLFQNPQIHQLARAVIYGPSNVHAEKPSLHTNSSYRHAAGLKPLEATSGMIAWFGVMIEYTLSPDQEFGAGGVGNHTGTDYLAKHARYRRLLIEGRHGKNSVVARIFREWNNNVFPSTNTSDADEGERSEDEDHLETQRRARDGAQPIDDLLSQMSESDAGSDPGHESAPSDDDSSDAHTVNGETTAILQNLSLSSRANSPAFPEPDAPTRPNSPLPLVAPSGPRGGRRLVRGSDAIIIHADGRTTIDPYHVASADLRVNATTAPVLTAPNAPVSIAPNSITAPVPTAPNPTPSATLSQRSTRFPKRPVISARGAAINPGLLISDSVSAAVPAVGGGSSTSTPAGYSDSVESGLSRPQNSESVTVAMPAPRRASNRNKQADAVLVADNLDNANVPAAGGKPVNARGRGGKAGKKSRGT